MKPDRSIDLRAPMNDEILFHRDNPNPSQLLHPGEMACDFSNTNSQHERYKNLMNSNYYNLNANTSAYNSVR
jgi:hypothetical protein